MHVLYVAELADIHVYATCTRYYVYHWAYLLVALEEGVLVDGSLDTWSGSVTTLSPTFFTLRELLWEKKLHAKYVSL